MQREHASGSSAGVESMRKWQVIYAQDLQHAGVEPRLDAADGHELAIRCPIRVVERSPTVERVRTSLIVPMSGRLLASFKVAKTIVFDSDLPREDSGKLFKRRIRDRYWRDTEASI
jgi:acyl-CoA synthetase (AMP-forming)/AMP-acid ligase II